VATSTRHAQSRRPRQRVCPPNRIAGAPCPDRSWLVVAHAYLDGAPAQHARITVSMPARCRSCKTAVSACPVVVAALSLMLIQSERRLVMLWLRLRRYRLCSHWWGADAVCSFGCRALSLSLRWPNQRFQPTPLRVHEIGAILSARICYNGITIYWRRG
jgi:hypothetical protein